MQGRHQVVGCATANLVVNLGKADLQVEFHFGILRVVYDRFRGQAVRVVDLNRSIGNKTFRRASSTDSRQCFGGYSA
jgi:hypothetical protein